MPIVNALVGSACLCVAVYRWHHLPWWNRAFLILGFVTNALSVVYP